MATAAAHERVGVTVRIRPAPSASRSSVACTSTESSSLQLTDPVALAFASKHGSTYPGYTAPTRSFGFDRVLGADATQSDVYDACGKQLIEHALTGFHATLMAYGQSSSGKTHTLGLGQATSMTGPNSGLVPRLCSELFDRLATDVPTAPSAAPGARGELDSATCDSSDPLASTRQEYAVTVSFLELYCEQVYDLLTQYREGARVTGSEGHGLRVREHPATGVHVEGLTEVPVTSAAQALEVVAAGCAARTVAETRMNAASTRGHALFTLTLTQRTLDTLTGLPLQERKSRVTVVDLAGSERSDSALGGEPAEGGSAGAPAPAQLAQAQRRQRELAKINTSLSALGAVVKALGKEQGGKGSGGTFVPYRNSVLTWLLRDSIGGNAKTTVLATVSPSEACYGETLSTLKYAQAVKRVVQRPVVNEGLQPDASARVIAELRAEIALLRQQLLGAGAATAGGDAASAPVLTGDNDASHRDDATGADASIAREHMRQSSASSPALDLLAGSPSSPAPRGSPPPSSPYLALIGSPSPAKRRQRAGPRDQLGSVSGGLQLWSPSADPGHTSSGPRSPVSVAVEASAMAPSSAKKPLPPPNSSPAQLLAHLEHRERLVAHLLLHSPPPKQPLRRLAALQNSSAAAPRASPSPAGKRLAAHSVLSPVVNKSGAPPAKAARVVSLQALMASAAAEPRKRVTAMASDAAAAVGEGAVKRDTIAFDALDALAGVASPVAFAGEKERNSGSPAPLDPSPYPHARRHS